LNRIIRGVPLLALMAGGRTLGNSRPRLKLRSGLTYIKIVNRASSWKYRYLGQALSFRMLPSHLGADGFELPVGGKDKHDLELRKHAKRLGANVIEVAQSQDTGLSYLIQVNPFHGCWRLPCASLWIRCCCALSPLPPALARWHSSTGGVQRSWSSI